MGIEPRFIRLKPKKLIGLKLEMSFAENRTGELWQTFMPRRHEIKTRVSTDFISMQKYHERDFFKPDAIFTKWAVVEVDSFADVPEGMGTYELQEGDYAVFDHTGPASSAPAIMKYIFGEWLPQSGYELDDREHFEVLPENYNPMDPNATEEIWVPLKPVG